VEQIGGVERYWDNKMKMTKHAGVRMVIWVRSDGYGTRMIFYLWVTSVLDPNRDRYGTSIFFHLWVT
jgi:hypothetical protein